MNSPVLAIVVCLAPFVAFPALLAAALGVPIPRPRRPVRFLLLLAVAALASYRAYAHLGDDDKPQPPEPPGPYIPGGTWETVLHRDPFTGAVDLRREYRLPPSVPEVPVEKQ